MTKAVEYRLNELTSMPEKIRNLRNDILNIPSHVFGEHKRCAEIGYFCDGTLKDGEENVVPQLTELGLFQKLEVAVTYLSLFCKSLLYSVNSNSVESYNSIVSKFIGGKQINFGLKGSYQTRCASSVVQFNTQQVMTTFCKSISKNAPNTAIKMEMKRKISTEKSTARIHAAKEARREFNVAATSASRKSTRFTVDKDYGPNAQRPDLDAEEYAVRERLHYERLEEWRLQREEIENNTRLQAQSDRWIIIRKKLLTASNFGKVA